PSMERSHTLECISNEVGGNLISNAKWRGVPLRMILEMAGADTTVRKVAFRCADGYTTAIPMSDALHPDTLLAYEMNGERLPSKHGLPARLLGGAGREPGGCGEDDVQIHHAELWSDPAGRPAGAAGWCGLRRESWNSRGRMFHR